MVGVDADRDLFERFRTHGDVAALGQLFDLHAPALLRVALHLTKDPAAAEDLVQSTFLRAIEVRDGFDRERPLLPWLVGVLHNRARHHRWQVERIPDPVRVAQPRVDDPVSAAAAAEFDASIDTAIAALPEHYRPVLRLHLAYGHKPAEIAHALDRPAGTVRSQLARGLEQLRRLLPASFAGALAVALAPGQGLPVGVGLAAMKQTVLASGAKAVAALVATTAIGPVLGGSLVMKKYVMALAGIVLAAGILFGTDLIGGRSNVAPSQPQVAPARGAGAVAATDESATRPPEAGARTRADGAKSAARPTTGTLRVSCRFAVDDQPAWGLFLELDPGRAYDSLHSRLGRTLDDGTFEFDELAPGDHVVRTGRGGEVVATVEAGRTTMVELVIPVGIDVRGRVVDQAGVAVPHAELWLSRRMRDYSDGRHVTRADGAGQFFLRSVEPERFLSAVAPGFRAAVVAPLRAEVGSTLDLELVLEPDGVTLRGIVVDVGGVPQPGARLLIGVRQSSLAWMPELHAAFRPPVEVVSDERGEFVAHGFELGSEHPSWARAPGFAPWHRRVSIDDSRETFLRVELDTGATVTGQATNGQGAPVAGAFIAYRATAWAPFDGYPHQFFGPRWVLDGASTSVDGRYTLAHVPAGEVRLIATGDGHEARGQAVADIETPARWDPVLAAVELSGRVLDERGVPIAGVDITGQTARGKGNMASALTGADGTFVCRRVAAVPYNVRFYGPGDEVRARPAAVVYGVTPGAPLEVRIPDAAMPTCTITGKFLGADGAVPSDGKVTVSAAGLGWEPSADVDPTTGRFTLGPLPAGTYRVRGRAGEPMRRSAWSATFEVVARECYDCGVLQMPVPGAIEVVATGPDAKPLAAGGIVLEDSTGWSENRWAAGELAAGRGSIDGVAPGRYRVGVDSDGLAGGYAEVRVEAGVTVKVEVQLVQSVARQLVYLATTEPVPIDLTFDWQLDGQRLHRYVNRWEGQAEIRYTDHLRPGRYELVVTSERGNRVVTHFVVSVDDPPGAPLRIALP